MPTVDAREDWTRRQATATPTGWKATRYFTVAYATSEGQAMAAQGIPRLNEAHPLTSLMLCLSIKAQSISPNYWEVQCDYGQPESTQPLNTDPLRQPATIKWQIGNQSQKIDQDIYGNPIVNTAKGKFASPASREFGTLFFTITRNEPFFNPSRAVQIQNKVNKTVFAPLGMPALRPGQCCCRSVSPSGAYQPRTVRFVEVSYTFEARAGLSPTPDPDGLYDGFKLVLLNQGKSGWYTDPTTGRPALGAFCDKYGNRISDDLLLDQFGVPIIDSSADTKSIGVMQQVAGGHGNRQDAVRAPYRVPQKVFITSMDLGNTWLLKFSVYDTYDFNTLNFR